jgi:hypothetical protein
VHGEQTSRIGLGRGVLDVAGPHPGPKRREDAGPEAPHHLRLSGPDIDRGSQTLLPLGRSQDAFCDASELGPEYAEPGRYRPDRGRSSAEATHELEILREGPGHEQDVHVRYLRHFVVGRDPNDRHAEPLRRFPRTMCNAAAEAPPPDRRHDPSLGELWSHRVEDRGEVPARRRPNRDHPGEALHIVGVPSMVPKGSAPVRRPPCCLGHEIAAVGTHQEVRSRYPGEAAANALSRAPIIEDHNVRDEVSMGHAHPSSIADILHGLRQAGRGESPLRCVPPRQGHGPGQEKGVRRHRCADHDGPASVSRA